MSVHAEEWAVKCRGLRCPLEKAVLRHLAFRADKATNHCWPTQIEIAEAVMADTRTVRTHLNSLEERGFITKLQKGNRGYSSVYLVHVGREIIPETVAEYRKRLHQIPETNNRKPETVAPNTGNGCRIPETNNINTGNGRMYQPKEPNIQPNKNSYMGVFQTLSEIPGFIPDDKADVELLRWLEKRQEPAERAEEVAERMLATISHNPAKGEWKYRDKDGRSRSYSNLRGVYRTWVRSTQSTETRSPSNAGRAPPRSSRREIILAEKARVDRERGIENGRDGEG